MVLSWRLIRASTLEVKLVMQSGQCEIDLSLRQLILLCNLIEIKILQGRVIFSLRSSKKGNDLEMVESSWKLITRL